MKVFVALSTLMALAAAAPQGYKPAPYAPAHAHGASYEEPAHYQYGYAVADDYSGVNFGASEGRDGYATNGEYHVQLPDGRLQTVTYHVGDAYSGYVADVSYSGTPHYGPAPHKAHAPAPYHAPVHHAAPAYHAPVHHAAPTYHAPVHHAAPSYHAPVHHAAPAYHAPVHAPTYHSAPHIVHH